MDQVNAAHSGLTNRSDFWWVLPLVMLLVGGASLLYLTYAAFVGDFYEWGPYVSPMYHVPYVPSWWKISPAFLLFWIPAGFRVTCYYGRKAYYRAVFAAPSACAVEQPYRKSYGGEARLPFIMNNLHRYFLYFALLLVVLHWYEFVATLFHGEGVYLGLGTLLIFVDTVALTLYVGGCHSLRHLVGGGKRAVFGCSGCSKKCHKVRYGMWRWVSKFNIFHNVWFWVSLVSISLADLYIRLLAMGVITFDPHVIF